MNVTDLRQAIKDALGLIDPNLTVDLYPPPNVLPPHAYCAIDSITPDTFDAATSVVRATVTVVVSQADKDSSWELVDQFVSDDTFRDALNDVVGFDVRAVSYDNIGSIISAGGIDFLGFTVNLEILA